MESSITKPVEDKPTKRHKASKLGVLGATGKDHLLNVHGLPTMTYPREAVDRLLYAQYRTGQTMAAQVRPIILAYVNRLPTPDYDDPGFRAFLERRS